MVYIICSLHFIALFSHTIIIPFILKQRRFCLGLLLQLEWLKSELCKHVLFAYFLSLFLSIPHFVILRLLCALECSIHSYMQSFAIFLQCFFPFCMLYNSPAMISWKKVYIFTSTLTQWDKEPPMKRVVWLVRVGQGPFLIRCSSIYNDWIACVQKREELKNVGFVLN